MERESSNPNQSLEDSPFLDSVLNIVNYFFARPQHPSAVVPRGTRSSSCNFPVILIHIKFQVIIIRCGRRQERGERSIFSGLLVA